MLISGLYSYWRCFLYCNIVKGQHTVMGESSVKEITGNVDGRDANQESVTLLSCLLQISLPFPARLQTFVLTITPNWYSDHFPIYTVCK